MHVPVKDETEQFVMHCVFEIKLNHYNRGMRNGESIFNTEKREKIKLIAERCFAANEMGCYRGTFSIITNLQCLRSRNLKL